MPQILLRDRTRAPSKQKGTSAEATITKVLRGLTYILRQVSQMTDLPKTPTKQVCKFSQVIGDACFFLIYRSNVQIHSSDS